ncbi:MAG: DUF4349 domain-containing protein [Chloroflexi bacterium]|nr:DUF4349 domain-containing protein [Chloroflexota bacterium]
MKRFILFTLLILTLVLGIGCGPQIGNTFSKITNGLGEAEAPAAEDATTADTESGVPGQRRPQAPPPAPGANTEAQAQDQVRMIVYTGAVSLQVNDTADTINKINDLLKNVNGYIASKSVVAFGKDKLRGSISIRIPAAALETTLAQIKALAVKVLKETASSQDVTAEYVDLDARRKNLEVYEVELQKMLETERERPGSKAADLLAIYNQLTEVRGQIEQIKGRQKYLENTSALATYTIEFVPIEDVVVEGKPGWDPGRTAGLALDRLVSALQGLGDIAINLTLFVLPILLILFLPVVVVILILRAFLKRRQPKQLKPAG